MYEHKRQPLASRKVFFSRIWRNMAWSMAILTVSLFIGTVGFRFTTTNANSWMDCFHNAAMLLSGMGPVIVEFPSNYGKLFSSLYALYSGIALLSTVSLLLAPVAHRFFHQLHVEES